MRRVTELLREKGLEKKRFGLEMDGCWFNARMYVTLLEGLPEAFLMDGTNLVNWAKTVKSPAEITYMKQAAQICEMGMKTTIDEIDIGIWEKDVAQKFLPPRLLAQMVSVAHHRQFSQLCLLQKEHPPPI